MNSFKKTEKSKAFAKKTLAAFAILLAATTFSVSAPVITEAARANAGYVGEVVAGPGVAVAETKAGTLQGYVHKGIFNYKGV